MEKTGQPARFSFLFFLLIKAQKISLKFPKNKTKTNVKSIAPIMDARQYTDCYHVHDFTNKILFRFF